MSEQHVNFFVDGLPKGQPRPRAFARKMGSKYVARFYDSDTADVWKMAVGLAVRANIPEGYFSANRAYYVSLVFTLPRPAYMFGKGGVLRPRYFDAFPTSKPDSDNLAKLVLDCITKAQNLWRDDSQVVILCAQKQYAMPGSVGVQIEIKGLHQYALD